MNNAINQDERIAKMTLTSVYPHYLTQSCELHLRSMLQGIHE